MSSPTRVAIIGATGNTGKSIVNGLIASQFSFEITALTRASSLHNEANEALRALGVTVAAFDILGPKEDLVSVFTGQDVVISAVHASQIEAQVNLVEPLKEAKVKRFIPCDFATPAPEGLMILHDRKIRVLDAVQRAYVPYTVVDVGWWYQGLTPPVPSGKTDHAVMEGFNDQFYEDGNVPIALIDKEDIGRYVARIIVDPRTINKKVFVYSEVRTQKEVWKLVGEITGEEPIVNTVSKATVLEKIADAKALLAKKPDDLKGFFDAAVNEYALVWAIRGDNAPEAAKYLGYLDGHELYPDAETTSLRAYYHKLVETKPEGAKKMDFEFIMKNVVQKQ